MEQIKFKKSYRLNLLIDEKFAEILNLFKRRFPLMKDVDIIKMAVSGYYSEHFVEYLSKEDSKNIEKSKRQIKEGKAKTFDSVEETMDWLRS